MHPRALSTARIFFGTLYLSHLDNGSRVVHQAADRHALQRVRLLAQFFACTKAVDFVLLNGELGRGRDAESVYELAREWARRAVAGKLAPSLAELGPVAVDLAFAIGERWQVAS